MNLSPNYVIHCMIWRFSRSKDNARVVVLPIGGITPPDEAALFQNNHLLISKTKFDPFPLISNPTVAICKKSEISTFSRGKMSTLGGSCGFKNTTCWVAITLCCVDESAY